MKSKNKSRTDFIKIKLRLCKNKFLRKIENLVIYNKNLYTKKNVNHNGYSSWLHLRYL